MTSNQRSPRLSATAGTPARPSRDSIVRSRRHVHTALDAISQVERASPDSSLAAARVALQAALVDQNAYLHSAAHDLRNPLAAIRGQVQLLRRRVRHDAGRTDLARVDDGLAAIEEIVNRAAELVDQLLDADWPDGAPEDGEMEPPRPAR